MLQFGLVVIVVFLLITGMAIGVIMGRKPISGSCGGVGAALGEKEYSCDICGGDPNKCDNQENLDIEQNLAYDVSQKPLLK